MAVGYKSGSRALGAFLNFKVSTNVIGLYIKSSEDSELWEFPKIGDPNIGP